MTQSEGQPKPLGLVAELTHRCPLGCPYCSNPLTLERHEDELDAETWARVFKEAAGLGVRDVHLSGGEPGARRDLVDITAHAREAGLATHLLTSGVAIATRTLRDLWEAGLDRIQVSFQDSDAVSSDRIAGSRGAFQRKHALAAEAVRLGLPLTVDCIVHRANIERIAEMVDLALGLKAARIHITHVRYVGWALKNRAALMPSTAEVARANTEVEELRRRHNNRIVIDADGCRPDWPVISPSGRIQTGDAAGSRLELNIREHSLAAIWAQLPACSADLGASHLPDSDAAYGQHEAGFAALQGEKPYDYRHM